MIHFNTETLNQSNTKASDADVAIDIGAWKEQKKTQKLSKKLQT